MSWQASTKRGKPYVCGSTRERVRAKATPAQAVALMDARRARTALCAYLVVASSSRVYAFAPSVQHVSDVQNTPQHTHTRRRRRMYVCRNPVVKST